MKLFHMASEVRKHAIDRGCSNDAFSDMQVGLVIVGSKKEKDDITDKQKINFIYP
jgi:hypothetical protein